MNPDDDPNKPVAYDSEGRPLYAHPPAQVASPSAGLESHPANESQQAELHRAAIAQEQAGQQPGAPQVVYMTRAVDPHQQEISDEVNEKHTQSIQKYPSLNLSEGEFVISAVKRHPIGLVSIWGVVAIAVLIIFIGFPMLLTSHTVFGGNGLSSGAMISAGLVLLLTAALFVLGGIIATVVYNANRFYLTNESVIQHIQTSLFSKKDQTISLINIEDASYRQQGILQTILNYGAIRLSTEGEETTYRFNFVADPKKEIDRLNNAVESFKNFRPISGDD
jgi:hypothetical protein